MAAEVEKTLVPADALESQEIGDNPRQALFDVADRRLVAPGPEGAAVRRGQGLAVELAVRGQGQRFEPNIGRRNHVVGEAGGKMRAQRLGFGRRRIRPRRDVGHESLVAGRVLPRQHDGFAHAGMLGEPRFDLAKLDPEPPDLHLEIIAAEKLDRPVGTEPAKIAGPVKPFSRHERAGDKSLRRQFGPVEIAACDALSADKNLAGCANGDRFAIFVDNVNSRVRNRAPDRNARR